MQFKGFSLIDIMQPCVSFNRINTYNWYKKRAYDLFEEDYMPDDLENATKLARQWGDRIPIGILYRKEKQCFTKHIDVLNKGPLISQQYDPARLQAVLDA